MILPYPQNALKRASTHFLIRDEKEEAEEEHREEHQSVSYGVTCDLYITRFARPVKVLGRLDVLV